MKIYTRKGDTGHTSLFGGKKLLKCEELVEVYGSIDELNSFIGFVATQIEAFDAQSFLSEIQKDLLIIGSNLAGSDVELSPLPKRVKQMEERIDAMNLELPKLTHFVLPGGSPLGALIHVARSICRRVERQVVALDQHEKKDSRIIVYLNRLSDFLFMLARFINKQTGVTEIQWMSEKEKHT